MSVSDALAEWRIDFESKTVGVGETGVTLEITASWDDSLLSLSIPVIVREIDPGAFWAGALPYDTGANAANHPFVHGVTWNWDSPWAFLVEEVKPSAGLRSEDRCHPAADTSYDGVSPDQLVINAAGMPPGAPPEPEGRAVITLTFDIAGVEGQFEFDTACFSEALHSIFLVDGQFPPVNHGHEALFNKGVITVTTPDGILESDNAIPGKWTLSQNHPNPFNTNTLIAFSLAEDGKAGLEVFDILGRKVAALVDEFLPAGCHQASWNGENDRGVEVGSGVYFYRLTAADRTEIKKMILLK